MNLNEMSNWPMEFVPRSTISRNIVELRDDSIGTFLDIRMNLNCIMSF